MEIIKIVRTVSIGLAAIVGIGCATTPTRTQSEKSVNPKYLVQKGTPEYKNGAWLLHKWNIPEGESYEIFNNLGSSVIGQQPLPEDFYLK